MQRYRKPVFDINEPPIRVATSVASGPEIGRMYANIQVNIADELDRERFERGREYNKFVMKRGVRGLPDC